MENDSSLFSVGEVNQKVKIWNSRTQEIEAGKDVCRTTEEITAEHSRLWNAGSVIDRQVSRRRELPADWMAGMPLLRFEPLNRNLKSFLSKVGVKAQGIGDLMPAHDMKTAYINQAQVASACHAPLIY